MTVETSRPEVIRRTTCRVCDTRGPERVLSLGLSPLANSFLRSADEAADERRYPLDLYFCADCGLLQLLDVVDPAVMFRHYLYVTGTSTTIAAHNVTYASTLADLLGLGPGDLVAEVASNDGSLLRCFAAHGVGTLGIEPARNLAAEASAAGVETVSEFFTKALAADLAEARGRARVVAANNVLAHVDDPVDFLEGCRTLVSDDGLVTIEVPYVGDLLDRVEYDTVYHEHLSYFSIASLLRLCDRAGLAAVRIDRVPVHGGSLRLYLSRSAGEHAPAVRALESDERRQGIVDIVRYREFAERVRQHRSALRGLLDRLIADGARVIGYGAPAKGNTLLNYCGIDGGMLAYILDKNPLKVGLLTPGTHIPVRAPEALEADADRPDHMLILAWNFAEEIMQQQRAFKERGGRFIVPIPEPRVI